jgi:lipopolysaccharide/colanic/teichoic acid biosynthesis glycosyltransferase
MISGIERKGLPRIIEVALALSGLAVMLPLLIVAALAMKLTSRGPVLFRQQRVGHGGKEFSLYKIRTMRNVSSGPKITSAKDRRVTRVGKLLRKSKIDEMPQLWNVVNGDMTLVGPRPEVPELVDKNDPMWQEILSVKPGVTHPITLKLRHEELLLGHVDDQAAFYKEILQPYKMQGYVRFLKYKSWHSDVAVITQTFKYVFLPKAVPVPNREELKWAFPE